MTVPLKSKPRSPGEIGHVHRGTLEAGEPVPLPELARVVVLVPVETLEGDRVEAGTEGVIVHAWRDGAAYEVEFRDALGPASVEAANVRAIDD